MSKRRAGVLAAAVIFAAAIVPATAGAAQADGLQMYRATLTPAEHEQLATTGYDVVAPQPVAGGVETALVLSPAERAALAGEGIELELFRDERGRTARELARAQRANGFEVWRDYDGEDGIAAWLHRYAERHGRIAKLKVIGTTVQGREIIAIRLTQEYDGKRPVKGKAIRRRPATLFQGTTHAREWISTEVTRRELAYFGQRKRLLRGNQIWFVPVVNPDGYQYTFDHERLWRKNLADNDGDGQITSVDGVDLNRNYPDHFNYDDEGSSTQTTSDTYRGPAPASEPETRANIELVERIDPVMAVSYHSFGPLILYPLGWQVQTPVPDDPVYVALSGDDAKPAIEGYDPGLSAELYTTNGEMTDWAAGSTGALAWTVELNEGCSGCGFVFPDDEALVQREFELNRRFARDLVRSARNPEKPRSHLNTRTKPFYLDTTEIDPTRANNPGSDFSFTKSFGDPQPVEVLARRSLDKVTVRYSINGGRLRKAPTSEWQGGERYGGGHDGYYVHLRGQVTGTNPGDRVEVLFQGKAKPDGNDKSRIVRSGSFTYEAVSESGARTLIVAAEDYTGISPAQDPAGPHYLSFYRDALDAAGVVHDVYDVDAEGRVAPDHLGVLSHYDAVLSYTGDDVITREPGMVAGTVSRLANDQMLEMRAFMNEGGNVLNTGKNAGVQFQNAYRFDPVANAPCDAGDAAVDARCQVLSDDFQQYYLGAYVYNDGGGVADPNTGQPYPVVGVSAPFAGAAWTLNGGDGADNQDRASSLVTTSSVLPASEHPQFASEAPLAYDGSIGGAAVSTADSLYFGFGLEGLETAEQREQAIGDGVGYLLRSP